MRKLYLSSVKILELLRDGKIGPEDLSGALFCLGGTRQEVFYPPEMTLHSLFHKCPERRDGCVKLLLASLVSAEADGRVVFREEGSVQTYAALNDLLERNGLKLLQCSESNHFTWPRVAELVSVSNQGLEAMV